MIVCPHCRLSGAGFGDNYCSSCGRALKPGVPESANPSTPEEARLLRDLYRAETRSAAVGEPSSVEGSR